MTVFKLPGVFLSRESRNQLRFCPAINIFALYQDAIYSL